MNQNINTLKARYPFPQQKPKLKSFYWSLDGGGREIIADIIVDRDISLMLEIGVFFGGSALRWLETSTKLTLIGVDTFPNLSNYFASSYERFKDKMMLGEHDRESLLAQLQLENGTYLSAIANLWDYRERFVPVKGKSPEVLTEIAQHGVAPELIYLDGDNELSELVAIEQLFPHAIIAGNGWTWNNEGRFPIQEKVTAYAEKLGYEVQTSKGSWILREKARQKANSVGRPTFSLPKKKSNNIEIRNGLGNLIQKLEQQACKIAYLGASVTAQKQGYRPNLHQWFQEHFKQPHVEINGAIGGVISGAAVFLMDDMVIQHEPDFCIIEYSTVDMAWNSPEIGSAIEAMVRKLKDIDCPVCFLYLYRTGQKFNDFNPVIAWYEEVAEYYQIPSINVGRYIEASLKQQEFQFDELFRDFVHNTPAGGKFVAEYIAETLLEVLRKSPDRQLKPVDYDDYAVSDAYVFGQMFPIQRSMIGDRRSAKTGSYQYKSSGNEYSYFELDSNNELEFEIEGKLIAILVIIGRESGIVELVTPSRTYEYCLWDEYCHYDRLDAQPIDRHFAAKTRVKLRLTDKPIDYSRCRRPIDNPEAIEKSMKIVGLLVSGKVTSPVEVASA